jgi:spore coat polysaccharide biosynthesis protein SpsF
MATVILQARCGSTRLPGKALMPILGKPMLWYTIETLKCSPGVNRIVMAIPDNPLDDPLVDLARQCDINHFRGSENNVLERCYQAAIAFKDDFYFRATGDNPILDYDNPKRSLSHLISHNVDYCQETGMPIGTVLEAFTFEALERAYREGSSPEDIEHVTWYIKKSGTFKVALIPAPIELQMPQLRLTVDYPNDFERVKRIIQHLYIDHIPPFKEILTHLSNPIH